MTAMVDSAITEYQQAKSEFDSLVQRKEALLKEASELEPKISQLQARYNKAREELLRVAATVKQP
jgi:predicted  nucleic acid-binding Zn-ribbon protein